MQHSNLTVKDLKLDVHFTTVISIVLASLQ